MSIRKLSLFGMVLCMVLLFAACRDTKEVITQSQSITQQATGNEYTQKNVLPQGASGQYDSISQRSDNSILFTTIDNNGLPHAFSTADQGGSWKEIENAAVAATIGNSLSPTKLSATVTLDGTWWVAGANNTGGLSVWKISADGKALDVSPKISTSDPWVDDVYQSQDYITVRYSTNGTIELVVLNINSGEIVRQISLKDGITVAGPNAWGNKISGYDFTAKQMCEIDLTTGEIVYRYGLPDAAVGGGIEFVETYAVNNQGEFFTVNGNGINRLIQETGELQTFIPYVDGSYDHLYEYQAYVYLLAANDDSFWISGKLNGELCLYRYAR